MLAKELLDYESTSFSRMLSRGELSAGQEAGIGVLDYTPTDRSGYYYKQKVRKKRIVIHFTEGFLGGDLSALTRSKRHVSAALVIARDGRIYRLFDTHYWSYHLGSEAIGGNKTCSSRSIAIELSNIGGLEKDGNWMWNACGSKYCRTSESEFFSSGPAFRGYRHFASFTEVQYDALNDLLIALCSKFDIPRTFIPVNERFSPFKNTAHGRDFSGICSHVNYRRKDKIDIGPLFDWNKIGA